MKQFDPVLDLFAIFLLNGRKKLGSISRCIGHAGNFTKMLVVPRVLLPRGRSTRGTNYGVAPLEGATGISCSRNSDCDLRCRGLWLFDLLSDRWRDFHRQRTLASL